MVSDYLDEKEGAERFYRGSYRSASDFRAKAAELDRDFDGARRERFPGLVRPVGEAARAKLDRVRTEDGFVVTTGQQPGLFGGPLYSLYKALTAVRLAEVLEEVLSRPVMPLFWIASDDHDWDESNHTWLIDGNNDLRELSLGPRPGAVESSLARSLLGPAVGPALEALRDCLPASDFSGHWLDRVSLAYRPENSVAAAFSELMAGLLEDTTIGFVDAADPALKAAATPVLEHEILSSAEGEAVLRERTRLLEQAGYSGQVTLMDGGLNLFRENGSGRQRLFRAGDEIREGKEGAPVGRQELLERLRDDPEGFSPNVLLRPVVESFLFPTLSYVGGPGEMAYFGQLGSFFQHHDVSPPIVTPRASFLVVESKVDKVLDKFGLTPEALLDADRLLTEMAKEEVPEGVTRALGIWRGAIGSGSKDLVKAVADVDPTLKGAVTAVRNTTFAALSDLEKKVVQAVKRESETTLAQVRKAEVNLWPRGRPQDRVLNPLHFLARFGREFTGAVKGEIRVELGVETG